MARGVCFLATAAVVGGWKQVNIIRHGEKQSVSCTDCASSGLCGQLTASECNRCGCLCTEVGFGDACSCLSTAGHARASNLVNVFGIKGVTTGYGFRSPNTPTSVLNFADSGWSDTPMNPPDAIFANHYSPHPELGLGPQHPRYTETRLSSHEQTMTTTVRGAYSSLCRLLRI